MPFGPYKDFQDCINKNKNKDSPGGYCAMIHKKITGEWPGKSRKGNPLKNIAASIRSILQ